MKIGVVSDTHMPGHAKQLPQALKKGLEGVDLILHAGDWQTPEVVEQFRQMAPVEGVTGNVDSAEIMQILKQKLLLDLEGFRIGIVHGHMGKGKTTPERARNAFADEDVDLIIFGHSHIPFDEVVNGVRLFNPGSPTDKRRQPRFSYGILTLEEKLTARHIYYEDKS
jgi:hypothetical protein